MRTCARKHMNTQRKRRARMLCCCHETKQHNFAHRRCVVARRQTQHNRSVCCRDERLRREAVVAKRVVAGKIFVTTHASVCMCEWVCVFKRVEREEDFDGEQSQKNRRKKNSTTDQRTTDDRNKNEALKITRTAVRCRALPTLLLSMSSKLKTFFFLLDCVERPNEKLKQN